MSLLFGSHSPWALLSHAFSAPTEILIITSDSSVVDHQSSRGSCPTRLSQIPIYIKKCYHVLDCPWRSRGKTTSGVKTGHGEISALVHFVCSVLASGAFGTTAVSHCLAAFIALPDRRDCSGWRACLDHIDHHASGPAPAQNLVAAVWIGRLATRHC